MHCVISLSHTHTHITNSGETTNCVKAKTGRLPEQIAIQLNSEADSHSNYYDYLCLTRENFSHIRGGVVKLPVQPRRG